MHDNPRTHATRIVNEYLHDFDVDTSHIRQKLSSPVWDRRKITAQEYIQNVLASTPITMQAVIVTKYSLRKFSFF